MVVPHLVGCMEEGQNANLHSQCICRSYVDSAFFYAAVAAEVTCTEELEAWASVVCSGLS